MIIAWMEAQPLPSCVFFCSDHLELRQFRSSIVKVRTKRRGGVITGEMPPNNLTSESRQRDAELYAFIHIILPLYLWPVTANVNKLSVLPSI